MRVKDIRAVAGSLLAAWVLLEAGQCAAQSFFVSFNGAPASIACTNTAVTLAPGLSVSWNLPPETRIRVVETAAGNVIQDTVSTLPSPSGTVGLSGTVPFTSTPYPYTFTYSGTPLVPGATTSSASFLCASATGTNFAISNGAPFTFGTIPTLDRWELFLLAALLGASAIVLFRRRLFHS